jgi:hypothetical protein
VSGQTARTIELLRAGWVTPLQSAAMGGCLSLSQRVGELRRAGYTVLDRWEDLPSGARVKAYAMPLDKPAE